MEVWIRPFIAIGTLIHISLNFLFPQFALAHTVNTSQFPFSYDKTLATEYSARKARNEALERLKREASNSHHIITAYTSAVEETDASPFITASGTHVRDGIVAANTLPFGAKIMIPDLFGNKVFTVEDRMAPKNWHKIDIWFSSKQDALRFGVKKARVIVLPQEIVQAMEKPSV